MTRPFHGLRVIDFTHVLAGPACAFYLGLLGAEVIKVESPGRGDAMRHRGGTDPDRAAAGMSTAYLTQAAGKHSVALDLDDKDDRQAFDDLLATADILVENHRPSTLKRLGLTWDFLHAQNPRLIHCAMTGYGRGGPREDAPAYDVNIQAASGLMTLTGTAETGPMRTGAPIIDYSVALAAAFAISTALYERERTGKGQFIDVSMLDTALLLMSSNITDYRLTGHEPRPRGNAANSRSPSAGTFPCKDGQIVLGVNEDHQFRALAHVLDRAGWLTDPRFADPQSRVSHGQDLSEALTEALSTRSAGDWEELLLANDVPAARIRTLPEALADPHLNARGFLRSVEDLGPATVPGLPFRYGVRSDHQALPAAEQLGASQSRAKTPTILRKQKA
ncbi:CaiB/BaiF CoA transferase family protein [Aestuariibius sp. 2305UL40-4]|uniref:CaiB/BaiF CoA transferase family protein n=1 Tax=Aestuariibius violaceus TaxID=3234132 RepID=UPI00345E6A81